MAEGNTISMKLLINSKTNKVLFAEAGKECVDFFLHLLALPIGTVVKCLTAKAMVGSLGNLYDSLENLSVDYLQPNATKDCLLNPKAELGTAPEVPLLMINEARNYSNSKPVIYTCSYICHSYGSDGVGATCGNCGRMMTRKMTYVNPRGVETTSSSPVAHEWGYVKGVVTYMIMDDLAIKPMSTISSITLLNKFNVTDVGCLVEKMVSLDMTKGIALLRASFMSKTVLTDVFLANKAQ